MVRILGPPKRALREVACGSLAMQTRAPSIYVAAISVDLFGMISKVEPQVEFNVDGIATAQGGRQWWPSTVKSVLDRST